MIINLAHTCQGTFFDELRLPELFPLSTCAENSPEVLQTNVTRASCPPIPIPADWEPIEEVPGYWSFSLPVFRKMLGETAYMVLQYLQNHAEYNVARPYFTHYIIAADLCVSKARVTRAIIKLRALGLVEKHHIEVVRHWRKVEHEDENIFDRNDTREVDLPEVSPDLALLYECAYKERRHGKFVDYPKPLKPGLTKSDEYEQVGDAEYFLYRAINCEFVARSDEHEGHVAFRDAVKLDTFCTNIRQWYIKHRKIRKLHTVGRKALWWSLPSVRCAKLQSADSAPGVQNLRLVVDFGGHKDTIDVTEIGSLNLLKKRRRRLVSKDGSLVNSSSNNSWASSNNLIDQVLLQTDCGFLVSVADNFMEMGTLAFPLATYGCRLELAKIHDNSRTGSLEYADNSAWESSLGQSVAEIIFKMGTSPAAGAPPILKRCGFPPVESLFERFSNGSPPQREIFLSLREQKSGNANIVDLNINTNQTNPNPNPTITIQELLDQEIELWSVEKVKTLLNEELIETEPKSSAFCPIHDKELGDHYRDSAVAQFTTLEQEVLDLDGYEQKYRLHAENCLAEQRMVLRQQEQRKALGLVNTNQVKSNVLAELDAYEQNEISERKKLQEAAIANPRQLRTKAELEFALSQTVRDRITLDYREIGKFELDSVAYEYPVWYRSIFVIRSGTMIDATSEEYASHCRCDPPAWRSPLELSEMLETPKTATIFLPGEAPTLEYEERCDVEYVANLYKNAAKVCYGITYNPFYRGVKNSKYYKLLLRATQMMYENNIAPAQWIDYSFLKFPVNTGRPPPIVWTFSLKRLAEQCDCCENSFGRVPCQTMAGQEILRRHAEFKYAMRLESTDKRSWEKVYDVFVRFFPPGSLRYLQDLDRKQAHGLRWELQLAIERGEWIWDWPCRVAASSNNVTWLDHAWRKSNIYNCG